MLAGIHGFFLGSVEAKRAFKFLVNQPGTFTVAILLVQTNL